LDDPDELVLALGPLQHRLAIRDLGLADPRVHAELAAQSVDDDFEV
jgi:hypothetical protein